MSFGSTLESIPLPVLAHCLSYLLEDGDILSFEGASRACRSLRHAADLVRAGGGGKDRGGVPGGDSADWQPTTRSSLCNAVSRGAGEGSSFILRRWHARCQYG